MRFLQLACELEVEGFFLEHSGRARHVPVTMMQHSSRFFLPLLLSVFVCARCSADVRLVDAAGSISNVGLLQVRTDAGFGTVCGANPAAADVVCRALGYSYGSVSTSPCGFYGGANLCGAPGSPVVRCSCHMLGNHFHIFDLT